MSAIWDPRDVLDIYPDSYGFTCVGTTKKGLRCKQSMISGADLSKASRILNTIALWDPTSLDVYEELSRLAFLTLCPRWHRKPGYCQVSEMVHKWHTMILDQCDSIPTRTPVTTSRRRPRAVAGSGLSITTSPSETVRVRRAPPPPSESVIEEITVSRVRRVTTISPPEPIVSTSPASSPRSPVSTVAAIPPAPRRTPTPAPTHSSTPAPPRTPTPPLPSPPATPTRRINGSGAITSPTNTDTSPSRRQNPTNNSLPLTPSTPTTSAPPPTPCPEPHRVKRKPITEDCAICQDHICCPDDAVWCRAECGQNIHRECFAQWRSACLRQAEERRMDFGGAELGQEASLAAVKCVFCRATWKWEWQD